MLSDADIDRWGRQILLPEVGGRGQERLLATTVQVVGDDAVAAAVVDLLRRSGVGRVTTTSGDGACPRAVVAVDPSPALWPTLDADVPVVLARTAGAAAWVATLVGRPCGACVAARPLEDADDRALAAVATTAIAALVSAEVLRVLLTPPAEPRWHVVDLARDELRAGPVADTAGCARCR